MDRRQFLSLSAVSFALVSCGGGGEGASETVSNTVNTTNVVPIPIEEPMTTTDDLISNTTFEFTSGFELTLILSAIEEPSVQYFVNICSDYTQVEESYSINYDSCRLRTSFTESDQSFDVSLSAAETVLIAQVWPMENDAIPINFFWSRTDSNEPWEINVNN